jgi:hypothetical protein
MTAPSAGKARSPWAGPSSRWAGLGRLDPAARAHAALLPARAKPPGVTATAMANRANRIALAMSATNDPTTPTAGGELGSPIPVGWARLIGWEPDQTPPAIWPAHGHTEAALVPGLPSPPRTRTRSADPLPTPGRLAQRWLCRPDQLPPIPTDQHTTEPSSREGHTTLGSVPTRPDLQSACQRTEMHGGHPVDNRHLACHGELAWVGSKSG